MNFHSYGDYSEAIKQRQKSLNLCLMHAYWNQTASLSNFLQLRIKKLIYFTL
jgi:hypothetical protein